MLTCQRLAERITTFASHSQIERGANRMDAVKIVDVTGSTNDDLLKAGKEGAPHGCALAARRQTAGRGRRGHTWDSSEGNLLLSVILRPKVDPANLCGLAAVCGLAVLNKLDALGLAGEVRLKWPNDLYARGKKLGGILIEAARDDEGGYFAVAGIGINVAYTPANVPDAGLPAVSLAELNGTVPELLSLIDDIRAATVRDCDRWSEALALRHADGPLGPILGEYQKRLAWLGEEVAALSPDGGELARGIFAAVDSWGRAVLETPGGRQTYSSEKASLRPVAPR